MSEQQQEQMPAPLPRPQADSLAPLARAMSRRKLLATMGAGMTVLATAGGATWWILSQQAGTTSAHSASSQTPTATPSPILGTQRWRYQTGGLVRSSPAVAERRRVLRLR